MFTDEEWEIIYNTIYQFSPPPSYHKQKITLSYQDRTETFNNMKELVMFMLENKINDTDCIINYKLLDDKLYKKVVKKVEKILDQIKKES